MKMWGVILRIKFYFKNHITKYNVPKCNITNLSNNLSQPSIFNDKIIEESSSSSTPTDSKENGIISPITHDDFENDDATNDSDLFDVDDNPNNN
ncbi:hypothetical protein H8356DRAFT_1326824 [Neocallimastix lanati (nom. inval.)]|nr:hypothetical protein H8356DRAFT_1326824 [Neocallimastix sp. JGI-2020a]